MSNNRPPNPAFDPHRSTAAAVLNMSAVQVDALAASSARVLDLVVKLGDAGVFDLALPFPDDLDDRVDGLRFELERVIAAAPSADQHAKRKELAAQATAVVDEILDAEFGADGLARRTAMLVRTLARNVAALPAPVVRELFKTSDALDEHRGAIKRQAADDAVTTAHRVARVGEIVHERLNPPYGRTFDALDAADLVTAVAVRVGRNRAGELSDLDLHGEVASLLMPYADDDRRAKGLAGLVAVAAEVVSAVTADAAFYAYQRGLADGRARLAAESNGGQGGDEWVPLAELITQADEVPHAGDVEPTPAEVLVDLVPLPVELDPATFAGSFGGETPPLPAGYVTVWTAAGDRLGWREVFGQDWDEWAEAVGRPAVVVKARDYQVEPGTMLQVGLYTTDGGLVARRPVVAEDGRGTITGHAALRHARPVTR